MGSSFLNVEYFVFPATNPDLKKSAKVQHGFKVTSDGRLIIRDEEDEDVKDKGRRNPVVHPSVLLCTLSNILYSTPLPMFRMLP